MKSLQTKVTFSLFVIILLLSQTAAAQPAPDTLFNNPESLIQQLYKEVTFPAGISPNWDKVKSMFIHDAVIILRTSRDTSTIFNVEGFILDFITFIEKAKVRETGFEERIIRMKPLVFGDIANILVLYEANIPGSKRPPQRGVDNFPLIKKDGRWWIASIVNEIPTTDRPLPTELLN